MQVHTLNLGQTTQSEICDETRHCLAEEGEKFISNYWKIIFKN